MTNKMRYINGFKTRYVLFILTQKLTAVYGSWLAKSPSLEDLNQLTQDVAREVKEAGGLDDVAHALEIRDSFVGHVVNRSIRMPTARQERTYDEGGVTHGVREYTPPSIMWAILGSNQ